LVKERIDTILVNKGYVSSREKARALVIAGAVYLGEERITKPDRRINVDALIEVRKRGLPYVSFGGVKLEEALKQFHIPVSGKKAIDIGSSTGGFTDCLLQFGASRVYAIDVGTHQLHESLREDPRVILKENFNARYLTYYDIGEKVDIITIDVSFISLKKILPPAASLLHSKGYIISLFKPQFELGRSDVGRGGIVKNIEKIERAIDEMKHFGMAIGLNPVSVIESPREKERKNREFFILWELQRDQNLSNSSQA